MLPTAQIRQLHVTICRLARGAGRRSNPGIGHQLTGIENVEQSLQADPEGFGDIEADFMDVHKSYGDYEKEMQQQRERTRHLMVKHKYFREAKLPNLLTYSEKEQMRLLHARDPEEWNAERLAESFPATAAIVEKVLQAKWLPQDKHRIRKHDEAVMRNWEQFRSQPEKLQLPPALKEHLQRFAARRIADIQMPADDWPMRPTLPQPKRKEFLSIITSCNKYADAKEKQLTLPAEHKAAARSTATTPPPNPENETYLLEKVSDRRAMRLQELKQIKLTPAELAAVTPNESHTPQPESSETLQNPGGTGMLPKSMTTSNDHWADGIVQKYESSEIVISAEDQQRYDITRVKDRIYIPRKMWRKGGTFRVEDCYYDDDGEFLYKVPGMTGRAS